MFTVPDEEWEHYVQKDVRDYILCLECYEETVHLIDRVRRASFA